MMRLLFLIFAFLLLACPGPRSDESKIPYNEIKEEGLELKCWLSPKQPSTRDNISVNYQISKAPIENPDVWANWYLNGRLLPNNQTKDLTHELTSKGNKINAEINIDDGIEVWGPFDCGEVTIINSNPVLKTLEIEQSEDGSKLLTKVLIDDPDEDDLEVSYSWSLNGEELEGEYEPTLNTTYFKNPGDRVAVSVTFSDRDSDPVTIASSGVLLTTQAPTITSVTLQPASPTVQTPIIAKASMSEPGSNAFYIIYDWLLNGAKVKSGTSNMLDNKLFIKGDLIEVVANATDGKTSAEPLKSHTIQVQNSSPKIISTAPKIEKPFIYQYQVKATDPDLDELTYSIQGPERMVIDPRIGLITWKFTKAEVGTHQITVTVTDDEGAKDSQTFTLQLEPGYIRPGTFPPRE